MADSTDSLVRNDPKSQELSYNNTTDRVKVELPIGATIAISGTTTIVGTVTDSIDSISTFVHKYKDLESDTVGNIIWDPASGKRFVLTDMVLNAATVGTIKIYDELNTADRTILQLAMPSGSCVSHSFRKPYPGSAIDNRLIADTYAGCSGHLAVWGYEI